jgi:hypothetical protein
VRCWPLPPQGKGTPPLDVPDAVSSLRRDDQVADDEVDLGPELTFRAGPGIGGRSRWARLAASRACCASPVSQAGHCLTEASSRGFCPRERRGCVAMGRPRKHPRELLDRGARVVIESGRPIAHVARDLGVPARRCAAMCVS